MSDDLEDDWALLGRGPGKVARTVKATKVQTLSFLEFIFTWIGRAWTGLTRPNSLLAMGLFVGGYGLVVLLVAVFRVDGSISYCQVVPSNSSNKPTPFALTGHRDWRADTLLLDVVTKEQALEWAKSIHCPIR